MEKSKNCAGTCEACVCAPTTKNKNEIVEFYASHYAQTETSFCCLVKKGVAVGSYSVKKWFPLNRSSFEKVPEGYATEIVVSAPLWLLEKLNITNLITIVK